MSLLNGPGMVKKEKCGYLGIIIITLIGNLDAYTSNNVELTQKCLNRGTNSNTNTTTHILE